MYAIYGNIYHQYTPNVSTYTIHGSYGYIYIYTYVLVYTWEHDDHQPWDLKRSRCLKSIVYRPQDRHPHPPILAWMNPIDIQLTNVDWAGRLTA